MTNDKDIKIRETYLIKPGSRSEEVKKKFSKWIDSQSNAQSSIISLIEHIIDRFGYADIMEHEISKKLHQERLYFEGDAEAIKKFEQEHVPPYAQVVASAADPLEKNSEEKKQEENDNKPKDEPNDNNLNATTHKKESTPTKVNNTGIDTSKF